MMGDKASAILSPREVRERRRQKEAAAVKPLVSDWRIRIANAMAEGETRCDTDTRTDLHYHAVLVSACNELCQELVSAGWASLEWRPKQASALAYSNQGIGQWSGMSGGQTGLSHIVELVWGEVSK